MNDIIDCIDENVIQCNHSKCIVTGNEISSAIYKLKWRQRSNI